MNAQVAFVSGSSRGIGKAIAQKLAAHGYLVYVSGRDEKQVQQTVGQIIAQGHQAKPMVTDLSQDRNVQQAIDEVIRAEGRLDLVIANLGSGKSVQSLAVPVEEVRRVFDLNFFSAVSLCSHSLPHLKGGQIIFISSIAGCESLGAPIAYSAAKSALLSYAKSLSDLAAPQGIRVNTISPGNVLFEGSTWEDKIAKNESQVRSYIKENVPLNDFAQPQDIADAVLFVVNSRFMTGHNLIVDGGQTRKFV